MNWVLSKFKKLGFGISNQIEPKKLLWEMEKSDRIRSEESFTFFMPGWVKWTMLARAKSVGVRCNLGKKYNSKKRDTSNFNIRD